MIDFLMIARSMISMFYNQHRYFVTWMQALCVHRREVILLRGPSMVICL
jgi:hypothetical protein